MSNGENVSIDGKVVIPAWPAVYQLVAGFHVGHCKTLGVSCPPQTPSHLGFEPRLLKHVFEGKLRQDFRQDHPKAECSSRMLLTEQNSPSMHLTERLQTPWQRVCERTFRKGGGACAWPKEERKAPKKDHPAAYVATSLCSNPRPQERQG